MTPFASVAMLEKLALLKIARCRAPVLSNASCPCLREVTRILVLLASFFLAMVLPPVTDARLMPGRRGATDREEPRSARGLGGPSSPPILQAASLAAPPA